MKRKVHKTLTRWRGCFGNIMAEIFACRQDEWEENLRIMGFFLGKFIYLLDAYEDVEKDEKNGCYNPFSSRRKEEGFDDEVLTILRMMMAECSRAFEKLPILGKYGHSAQYPLFRRMVPVLKAYVPEERNSRKMRDPYQVLGVSRDASDEGNQESLPCAEPEIPSGREREQSE